MSSEGRRQLRPRSAANLNVEEYYKFVLSPNEDEDDDQPLIVRRKRSSLPKENATRKDSALVTPSHRQTKAEILAVSSFMETPTTRLDMRPFRSVVQIRVGAKSEEFLIHANILIKESRFFKTRLESSPAGTIELKDINPDLFYAFATWLYHDKLPMDETGQEQTQFEQLISLYLLGERFGADALVSKVADKVLRSASGGGAKISAHMANKIYQSTEPGSKLRLLAAAVYALGDIDGTREEFTNPMFLHDVIQVMQESAEGLIKGLSVKGIGSNKRQRILGEFTPAQSSEENHSTEPLKTVIPEARRETTPASRPRDYPQLLNTFLKPRGK
ncbi:predicted protein [Uncinocarpus reesii 1704]|uniref:BTB domain-containing protein n=1 Tax=Uncinocarpus reesii (strain UAMH 1704) TaxID=336963 RepID=C4JGU8_UNCRE|nr:uncharacterized protein UREG_02610 [Uncinocarpus reesii 1704]EEP77761.1 predicted protein [Uncinocarpus reesii 1704]